MEPEYFREVIVDLGGASDKEVSIFGAVLLFVSVMSAHKDEGYRDATVLCGRTLLELGQHSGELSSNYD